MNLVRKGRLEVVPRAIAEKLEAHAHVIHTLIAEQRRGAAEQFGYAFLAGRALLQAKAIVPNGNARTPAAGFKHWVEANFPEITMRTAENWMFFAESIMARAHANAATSPLLIGSMEMSGQSHESILQLVPEVMDGKGMMHFMRECRLLRGPARQRNLQGKTPAVRQSDEKKSAVARRVWERIITDLAAGVPSISNIDCAADLKRYLNALVDAGNKIRAALQHLNRANGSRSLSTGGPSERQPPRNDDEQAKSYSREHVNADVLPKGRRGRQ